MAKNKYYVVWKGRKPGIYASWRDCLNQIDRFPGAMFKGFPNKAQAESAWSKQPAPVSSNEPVRASWSVDAACEGNPGVMEYQCVHTTTEEVIFHNGPYRMGTNNIGEFLAIVHALALQGKAGDHLPIYSDSSTAISWVQKRKAKTKLVRDASTEELWLLIERAEQWLKSNDWSNPLLKWNTRKWGEIPADFGRK